MDRWKLIGQHVELDRDAIRDERLRPFILGSANVGEDIILVDPALADGHTWLRVHYLHAPPTEFLVARTTTSPPIVRYYLRSTDGDGFMTLQPSYEGHWRASLEKPSELPWPTPSAWDPSSFLEKLQRVEQLAVRVEYRGYSRCRPCGIMNGKDGLRLHSWEWPAGFRHYIEVHRVRPTAAFEELVSQVAAT